jgi:hypothetical protein
MNPYASPEGVLGLCRWIAYFEVSKNLEIGKPYDMRDLLEMREDPHAIAESLLGPASRGH